MLHTSNGSTKPAQFQEDLLKFPPRLQKLARFISDSREYKDHISEYCREAGLSYESIKKGISKSKEKGYDFNNLVESIHHQKLTSFKPRMYKALISEGEKGNCKALELYFRLVGDLHPEPKNGPETVNNNLCFVMPMPSSIPMDQIEEPKEHNGAEDHGVIDVESVRDPDETVLPKFEVHQCPFCRDSFETLEMLGEHLSGEHEIG